MAPMYSFCLLRSVHGRRRSLSVARAAGLELTGKSEGLTLTDGTMELRADFGRMLPRLKQGRLQQELLVKVARTKGIERPWAIDATAGFGEDSLLLAAAGFTVDLYEQDCVIAALLKDALDRAADDPALAAAVARMRLHAGEDSIAGLRHTAELIGQGELTAPDVVYLDPMFPERTKSAAVKKKFQLCTIWNSRAPMRRRWSKLRLRRGRARSLSSGR